MCAVCKQRRCVGQPKNEECPRDGVGYGLQASEREECVGVWPKLELEGWSRGTQSLNSDYLSKQGSTKSRGKTNAPPVSTPLAETSHIWNRARETKESS
jgi:hypothetical protein